VAQLKPEQPEHRQARTGPVRPRPGRGRIEIVTKPGGKDFSGTFNVRFRDASLYARNAFAATKPQRIRPTFPRRIARRCRQQT